MSRKAQTQIERDLVYNGIMQGFNQSNLMKYLMEDLWATGTKHTWRDAQKLISDVRVKIREDFKAQHDTLRETQMARLEDLYYESRENNDRFGALNVIKEINKMTGLYEPTKIEAKIEGDITIDFGLD